MGSSKYDIPVLTGPTAVGKTGASFAIAGDLGGEIINMDSRQIYRMLDIGTAKPGEEEMRRVPHHLIDIVDPGQRYTVDDFVHDCRAAIDDIRNRGKRPLVIGGTPFYLSAIVGELDFCNVDRDEDLRAELRAFAEDHGNDALHEILSEADPESAVSIHPNDVYRVVRAIEIYRLSGVPASELRKKQVTAPTEFERDGMRFHVFALYRDREKLYHLVDARTREMYDNGLVEETRKVTGAIPGIESFLSKIIGYAQAVDLIEGKIDRQEAIAETARQTRRYAKRQLTWLRSMPGITWMDRDAMDAGTITAEVAAAIKY